MAWRHLTLARISRPRPPTTRATLAHECPERHDKFAGKWSQNQTDATLALVYAGTGNTGSCPTRWNATGRRTTRSCLVVARGGGICAMYRWPTGGLETSRKISPLAALYMILLRSLSFIGGVIFVSAESLVSCSCDFDFLLCFLSFDCGNFPPQLGEGEWRETPGYAYIPFNRHSKQPRHCWKSSRWGGAHVGS